jgi:predicted transcriptional regulator of viral defense system
MNIQSSIGKLDRKRLTAILSGTQHVISVVEAAMILDMPAQEVAKLLSRWVAKGWLLRIKRGLYVSLESFTANIDPWILAEKLYFPYYVGAQSAAKYWGITQQELSSAIAVLTTQKPRNRNPVIKGVHFSLRTVTKQAMFGLQTVIRGETKISVSDPSRTIIDFLVDPQLGGGIQNITDMLIRYLKSEYKNMDLLLDYAKRLGNGAVLKRLGFLLERCRSGEFNTIKYCHLLRMTGNIKLDPKMTADNLITRWGLWVPKNFSVSCYNFSLP